jgi:hypothetical protein
MKPWPIDSLKSKTEYIHSFRALSMITFMINLVYQNSLYKMRGQSDISENHWSLQHSNYPTEAVERFAMDDILTPRKERTRPLSAVTLQCTDHSCGVYMLWLLLVWSMESGFSTLGSHAHPTIWTFIESLCKDFSSVEDHCDLLTLTTPGEGFKWPQLRDNHHHV